MRNIECGMEGGEGTDSAVRNNKKYCSCYGGEAERYLQVVHKADGKPVGSEKNDCGCQDASGGGDDGHCVSKQ